jgi:hypothetical protein
VLDWGDGTGTPTYTYNGVAYTGGNVAVTGAGITEVLSLFLPSLAAQLNPVINAQEVFVLDFNLNSGLNFGVTETNPRSMAPRNRHDRRTGVAGAFGQPQRRPAGEHPDGRDHHGEQRPVGDRQQRSGTRELCAAGPWRPGHDGSPPPPRLIEPPPLPVKTRQLALQLRL